MINIVRLLKRSGITGRLRDLTVDADYAGIKGIAFDARSDTTIDREPVDGDLRFTDAVKGPQRLRDLLDAEVEDFEPQTSGLVSTKTGPAIRELAIRVGTSASPGVGFGRNGNLSNNTWLRTVGNVPSNRAGVTINVTNPVAVRVSVANRNVDTFDVGLYQHDGNSTNLTFIDSVSIVNARSATFAVNFALVEGRQLAARILNGRARDCNVGVDIEGTTV